MIFTVRSWSYTRYGVRTTCKNVEIDDVIWAILQQWAQDNRQLLLDAKKVCLAHADGHSPAVKAVLDAVLESHRLMCLDLPREYQVEGDLWDAIMQHLTLIQDNPGMYFEEKPDPV
jgi:predicted protein tyrosine phosphatase